MIRKLVDRYFSEDDKYHVETPYQTVVVKQPKSKKINKLKNQIGLQQKLMKMVILLLTITIIQTNGLLMILHSIKSMKLTLRILHYLEFSN